MVVRANEVIDNATEFVEDGPVTEDVVDVENLLPDDVFDIDTPADPPDNASHRTARPRSRRRELEDYFEQKRLEEWLYDPLDDKPH